MGHPSPTFDAFRQGLAACGYVEGTSVRLEPRFAEGQYDRFPALARELVQAEVDVIALLGAVTARAVKQATSRIPIVFAIVVDAVADRVVENLQRPGGNTTGVTSFDPAQPRKQLALLKEAIPGLTSLAILGDRGVSQALLTANAVQAAALDVTALRFRLTAPRPDLAGLFVALQEARTQAMLVLEEPLPVLYRQELAERAVEARLPTMFPQDWIDRGGLLGYGTSVLDALRRLGGYVDKILKGAHPGDLPVETLTHHELVVSLRTARQLGLTMPRSVVQQANRLIE